MGWMDGVLVLDKPQGISSHDAVQKVRRLLGIKRIGHLGTLDPIGTGVLPLVVGRATRLAQFFLQHSRTYEAVIRFGFSTDTYDAEGEPTSEAREAPLDAAELDKLCNGFRGPIRQTPPPVSAKKIRGVPAYKMARKKRPVELEPADVVIEDLELLHVEGCRAAVRVQCSSGTYMRSLAHDLGQRLGVGAHIESLRRTAMGEFAIEMAHTLDHLEELRRQGRLEEALRPPSAILPEMPAERVDAVTAARIAHGRDFRVSAFGGARDAKLVKAIGPDGRVLAIAEARMPLVYHPIVVL